MTNDAIEAATFLERLRNTTAQSHKNLEDLPVSLSIVNPTVTKQQYAHYLMLMHSVVKDAEDNIFPSLAPVVPDLASRNKAHMLQDDLSVLEADSHTADKPLSYNLPSNSIPFALGIMYVIEGSSLGGRFILKNITQALGYTPESGASYFAGYGNATGSHWKAFANNMVQYEENNKCEDEIIAGANYAFDSINAYFTKNTPQ